MFLRNCSFATMEPRFPTKIIKASPISVRSASAPCPILDSQRSHIGCLEVGPEFPLLAVRRCFWIFQNYRISKPGEIARLSKPMPHPCSHSCLPPSHLALWHTFPPLKMELNGRGNCLGQGRKCRWHCHAVWCASSLLQVPTAGQIGQEMPERLAQEKLFFGRFSEFL